jgi:hypothetical protein
MRNLPLSARLRRLVSIIICSVFCLIQPAKGQSTMWDALLTDSYWYVTEENLLSYITSGTSFTDPAPIVAWDQTLWSLGTAINGVFTGSGQATFYLSPDVSIVSANTITGKATDSGQVRMQFVSTENGATTIGIGQFREVNGATAIEMQMITGSSGSGGILFSHWAYMTKYNPDNFTPPDPVPNSSLVSQEWVWTDGTTWALASEDLFGVDGVGTFSVTDYRNGYFWGPGSGPTATTLESFTFLGSITPEGNVLFNILDTEANLISLTGQITGDAETGQMVLRQYEFDGTTATFGDPGYADVIPEPSTVVLLLLAGGVMVIYRRLRVRGWC